MNWRSRGLSRRRPGRPDLLCRRYPSRLGYLRRRRLSCGGVYVSRAAARTACRAHHVCRGAAHRHEFDVATLIAHAKRCQRRAASVASRRPQPRDRQARRAGRLCRISWPRHPRVRILPSTAVSSDPSSQKVTNHVWLDRFLLPRRNLSGMGSNDLGGNDTTPQMGPDHRLGA